MRKNVFLISKSQKRITNFLEEDHTNMFDEREANKLKNRKRKLQLKLAKNPRNVPQQLIKSLLYTNQIINPKLIFHKISNEKLQAFSKQDFEFIEQLIAKTINDVLNPIIITIPNLDDIQKEDNQCESKIKNLLGYDNRMKTSHFVSLDKDYINNEMEKNPRTSLISLSERYNNSHVDQQKLTPSYSRLYIKKVLGYSFKKPHSRSRTYMSPMFLGQTRVFLLSFIHFLKIKQFIFFDETTFSTNSSVANQWCTKDKYYAFKGKSNFSMGLGLFCTSTKIEYYEFKLETYNNKTLLNILKNFTNQFQGKPEEHAFYFDNASFHLNSNVQKFLTDLGFTIFYAVPGECKNNLCEYIFAILKKHHYKSTYNNQIEFKTIMEEKINELNPQAMLNQYRNVLNNVLDRMILIDRMDKEQIVQVS